MEAKTFPGTEGGAGIYACGYDAEQSGFSR
jgi:hypothetical protein